jgi:hypothetical protein
MREYARLASTCAMRKAALRWWALRREVCVDVSVLPGAASIAFPAVIFQAGYWIRTDSMPFALSMASTLSWPMR